MIESAPPPPPSSPEHTQGGDISIHSDGSRPVGLSCISFDLTASNEKKLGYLTGNKSRHLDGIRVGSCLNTWPLEEGQKYELVLIWSRELCELCWASEERGGGEGEEPPQVKQLFEDEIIVWLHLFTPMAQRGSASQAAQLAVLSHRWARLVVQGLFFFFSGEFCPFCLPAASVIIAFICSATMKASFLQFEK